MSDYRTPEDVAREICDKWLTNIHSQPPDEGDAQYLASVIRADRLALLDEALSLGKEQARLYDGAFRATYEAVKKLRAELAAGAEISNDRPLESTGAGPTGY
jgi:hypothetical protein